MIKIFDLIAENRIKILDTTDKNDALREISGMLATADSIGDAQELEKAIYEREEIISTSIGLGIAIPHVRLKSVTKLCIAIGIVKKGVDYMAFDDLPVNIIIMIAAPEGSHREYLSLLAKIALLLKNEAIRKDLLNAENPHEVFNVLMNH